jgi:hypothetical protein
MPSRKDKTPKVAAKATATARAAVGNESPCTVCATMCNTTKCARCHIPNYCSQECQRQHWRSGHKRECTPLCCVSETQVTELLNNPEQLRATQPLEAGAGLGGILGYVEARDDANKRAENPRFEDDELCPICVDRKDGDGSDDMSPGLCCSCGQQYCGPCKQQMISRASERLLCPTCREPLDWPRGVVVTRLLSLVNTGSRPRRVIGNAHCMLGRAYSAGMGVAPDHATAFSQFQKAANAESTGALFEIGKCYQKGTGIEQDDIQALIFFHMAAAKGNSAAFFELGKCYCFGTGTDQDAATGVAWFHCAAEKGHAQAQFFLALAYQQGADVPKDYVRAAIWYRRAAEMDCTNSAKVLRNEFRFTD